MVWRSRGYQELVLIQVHRSGRSSHTGGRENVDHGSNCLNIRVSFFQQGEINKTSVPGIHGTTIDTECYHFRVPGHLSNNCPGAPVEQRRNRGSGDRGSGGRTGTGMCQIRFGLEQNNDGIIHFNRLLLDISSTYSVGKNPYIFLYIHGCLEEEILTVVTNGGNK